MFSVGTRRGQAIAIAQRNRKRRRSADRRLGFIQGTLTVLLAATVALIAAAAL